MSKTENHAPLLAKTQLTAPTIMGAKKTTTTTANAGNSALRVSELIGSLMQPEDDGAATKAAQARSAILTEPQLSKLAVDSATAAALLSISPRSLSRLCKRGLLAPVIALRTPRYSLESLQKFLRDNTVSSTCTANL